VLKRCSIRCWTRQVFPLQSKTIFEIPEILLRNMNAKRIRSNLCRHIKMRAKSLTSKGMTSDGTHATAYPGIDDLKLIAQKARI